MFDECYCGICYFSEDDSDYTPESDDSDCSESLVSDITEVEINEL
jgi:hypothetical protein